MTKLAWSTPIDHSTDTGFRAWGSELNAKLAAIGLVQTADTGQINWATVVRAASNADAGYEVWRFNDALQATAPIFIRINYGTASSVSVARIQIQVGTGSNGSGTLTGLTSTARQITTNSSEAVPPNTPGRQSLLCHVAGFLGLAYKIGGGPKGFFAIARTVDSNGDPTATGMMVEWGGTISGGQAQAFRFASTAIAYTASLNKHALIPHSPAASLVGNDAQVYLHWTITPRVEPLNQLCTVLVSEFGQGSTFQINLVGAATRTYISCGDTGTSADAGGISSASAVIGMLWE